MADFKTIPLDKILVPERLRAVEEDHALAISASIVEHGLINPITVRRTPAAERPYTLVAGAHRLRAVELLDEQEIEAVIVEADKTEAQLQEITENLFRNELSALDRAIFVMTYREVWEQKHGKIERGRPAGGNRVNLIQLMADEAHSGFSSYVAERLGVSVPSVKRSQFIAQKLQPDLRRQLRGSPDADNQSRLLKLARMEPDRQRLVATSFAQDRDLQRAIELTDPDARTKVTRSPQDEIYSRLLSTWSRADAKTRRTFLEHIAANREPQSDEGAE